MKKGLLLGILLILFLQSVVWAADPVVETERVKVPLDVAGKSYLLDGMIYKPEGEGPFPAMIMTHGTSRLVADRAKVTADTYYVRNAKMFARLGITVLFVVRRGFGISDGPYAEGQQYDANGIRDYAKTGLAAAQDLQAAVQYMQGKPFVDGKRIVLLGQSTGGHSVIATGSLNLSGVVGVVNFAGGRGSTAPDVVKDEDRLVESFHVFGKTFKVPTIWLYSENDHYFGPALARKFLTAFQAGGAEVDFVSLPPSGEDGHSSFLRAKDNWYESVLEFLKRIGTVTEPAQAFVRSAA